MQKDNKFFDDLARMMSGATGSMFDVKREMETMMAGQVEKMAVKMNLVTRDEFDAVRDIARNARAETEALQARVDELEAALAQSIPQKLAPKKKPAGKK